MTERAFPVIYAEDVERSVRFYESLGFEEHFRLPPDGEPGYVGLELGASHLGIGRDPDAAAEPSERFSLWVYAEDCDTAVERLRAAGVTIVAEPADQPWGERVARVLDPDGNLVIVGQLAAAG
jgi:lactoylglutathione lyase